jgi:hypothetical protein
MIAGRDPDVSFGSKQKSGTITKSVWSRWRTLGVTAPVANCAKHAASHPPMEGRTQFIRKPFTLVSLID